MTEAASKTILDLRSRLARLAPEERQKMSELLGKDLSQVLDELEADMSLSEQHKSQQGHV
jgi:hypothetical protein